ncbi:Cfr10I/Bse634I family restriction endonuclease [Candidatus Woesearchaeota archaeon]|nr:Cfr10I/Bse634I family restriction endonuclease [Candidatus Woesearchaeota archaeon]
MSLTDDFLKKCTEEELKSFTKLGTNRKIAINSISLFQKFEENITEEHTFLEVLRSFENISNKSGMINFKKKPHPGSINNCMGRWFELIFFKYFDLILSKKSTKDSLKEICKLPSATDSKKFIDLFIEEQKTILKEINPATSNPDFIVLRDMDESVFSDSLEWKQKFQSTSFFGNVDIHTIVGIISIKTSARPDRRYQQLYEANLVKAIALRFGKTIKFVSITLHENEKNEEVYYSPSIVSIVQGGELKPSIDKSIVLEKISDIKIVYDLLFN